MQTSNKDNDSVAQLVEQMTLNHWVESSSLSGVTKESSQHNADCFFRITRKREHKQHFGQEFQLTKSTRQLIKGDQYATFETQTASGEKFDWKSMEHKNLLLLYDGLSCMGKYGRDYLKALLDNSN